MSMRLDGKWLALISFLGLLNFAGTGGGCDCFKAYSETKLVAEGEVAHGGFLLGDYYRGALLKGLVKPRAWDPLSATLRCNDFEKDRVIEVGEEIQICDWGMSDRPDPEVQHLPVPVREEQMPEEHEAEVEEPAPAPEPPAPIAKVLREVHVARGWWPDRYVQDTPGADIQATFKCNEWQWGANPTVHPGERITICGWETVVR